MRMQLAQYRDGWLHLVLMVPQPHKLSRAKHTSKVRRYSDKPHTRTRAATLEHIGLQNTILPDKAVLPAIQVQTLNGLMKTISLAVNDLTREHSRRC